MIVVDIDAISPVAQDYLKAIWSATEWGDPPITTSALAARFATSSASVTDTVKRLAAQGLLDYTPYRPVRLTATGERYAVEMVRRHRLTETFLARMLGYRWDEVHEDAERLEHALTDRLLERMDAALGHPSADPHGDAIPDADGTIRPQREGRRLADAEPGVYRVVRVSDADPEALVASAGLGLTPGAAVVVERRGSARRVAGPTSTRVPAEVASGVWVVGEAAPDA